MFTAPARAELKLLKPPWQAPSKAQGLAFRAGSGPKVPLRRREIPAQTLARDLPGALRVGKESPCACFLIVSTSVANFSSGESE